MSWALAGTAATAIYSAYGEYTAGKASAKYQKKQAAYNDKQNAKRARIQGTHVDTNNVRARIEASHAVQGVESSAKEARARARVAGAAQNQGSGSYDTILTTFASKEHEADSSIMQSLVSELVGSRLTRDKIATEATAGMSTGTQRAPSAAGAILRGASNYFQQTKNLKGAFG